MGTNLEVPSWSLGASLKAIFREHFRTGKTAGCLIQYLVFPFNLVIE